MLCLVSCLLVICDCGLYLLFRLFVLPFVDYAGFDCFLFWFVVFINGFALACFPGFVGCLLLLRCFG